MMMLGTFISAQFTDSTSTTSTSSPTRRSNDTYGTDSIDAPIDGFMMAADPKNEAAAKAVLQYLGSGDGRDDLPRQGPGQPRGEQQRRHVVLHAARRRRPPS